MPEPLEPYGCYLALDAGWLKRACCAASLPTSKIIFSKVCLITNRNDVPHLLVRIGNTRGNFLLNPEVASSLLDLHLQCIATLPDICGKAALSPS